MIDKNPRPVTKSSCRENDGPRSRAGAVLFLRRLFMTNFLDDSTIELPCENCGRVTKKTIGWIKRNTQFAWACGTPIHLDTSQFKREIAKVDRAFADLRNTLKKLNK